MYAFKKYIQEMMVRYPNRSSRIIANRSQNRYFKKLKPGVVQSELKSNQSKIPPIIKPPDPNIEIAKLQRQRSAVQPATNTTPTNRFNSNNLNTSKRNFKFTPDRRRPYDNVKISRLAPGIKNIVDRYQKNTKI